MCNECLIFITLELLILNEIGRGAFGCVMKAIWRGCVVAAKEIPTAGNNRILANELAVYRYGSD